MHDSIQVKFNDISFYPTPLSNTKVIPFEENYFEILKKHVSKIQTDYFWFFASFCKLDNFNFDFVPKFKNNINVWYTTHPKGGLNKEGNVFLIPTKQFKEQLPWIKKLKQYNLINYHADPTLEVQPMRRSAFRLEDPYQTFNKERHLYRWYVNKDIHDIELPNFFPSFWESNKIYTYGKTKDVMLLPNTFDIDTTQIIERELEYPIRKMDSIQMQSNDPLSFIAAASKSTTDYFFAIFPDTKIPSKEIFSYQPDRLGMPCHYVFDGPVYLCNKKLINDNKNPGLDLKLVKDADV